MTPKLKINKLLQLIGANEDTSFEYDEARTIAAMEKHHAAYSNIIIKVLSIIGGLLAALALIGFLFLAGIYESEQGLLVVGLLFAIGSILASRAIDHVFLDTTVITFYATGLILVAVGMMALEYSFESSILLVALLSCIGIFLSKGYMMVLTAVISLNATIVIFVMERLPTMVLLPVLLIGVVLFVITSLEAKLITSSEIVNSLFAPLQAGYFISFLSCMLFITMGHTFGLFMFYHNPVVLSIGIDVGILLLITKIINKMAVRELKHIVMIYAFALLILACVFYAPYIAGALFILILTYYYGYKAQVVISFVALLYFVFKFYYDLQMSLLVKSGLLFVPGVIMIALWFYVTKQLKHHEEN